MPSTTTMEMIASTTRLKQLHLQYGMESYLNIRDEGIHEYKDALKLNTTIPIIITIRKQVYAARSTVRFTQDLMQTLVEQANVTVDKFETHERDQTNYTTFNVQIE